jgi:hypothetical protein
MKKQMFMAAATIMAIVAAVLPGLAQTNLGADCGCPPVGSRPNVNLSTLAVNGGANDGSLTANNTILDCSKTWILDKRIYVDTLKTLTILPGTLVKAISTGDPTTEVALTISRGAKIYASGTATCPIVFTAQADPMDGSYAIGNIGKWGGICIAGRAQNNLTLAGNGPFTPGAAGKVAVADGIGVFEGFNVNNKRVQFGNPPAQFDNNDNSGVLRYVSIRYSGSIFALGAEINAISFGSVGRGTTVENVEVVSCADDAFEFYGGTVNIKNCAALFNNDDMLDYDLGWVGGCQFMFVLKNVNGPTTSPDSDNGIEADGDDQKTSLTPRSHPIIANLTMIGNSKSSITVDGSGVAAIRAKELTEGEIYNSIFANFRFGLCLTKSLGTRAVGPATINGVPSEAYHNWATTGGNNTQKLKVKCNTFVNMFNKTLALENNGTGTIVASDSIQFYGPDLNTKVTSLPGFDFTFTSSGNTFSAKPDPTPNPGISNAGCTVPTLQSSYGASNFFKTVTYRGAFDPNGENWLTDWTYASLLGATRGLQACPTDINKDGVTDNVDFLQLLGQFGQSCN